MVICLIYFFGRTVLENNYFNVISYESFTVYCAHIWHLYMYINKFAGAGIRTFTQHNNSQWLYSLRRALTDMKELQEILNAKFFFSLLVRKIKSQTEWYYLSFVSENTFFCSIDWFFKWKILNKNQEKNN